MSGERLEVKETCAACGSVFEATAEWGPSITEFWLAWQAKHHKCAATVPSTPTLVTNPSNE